MKVKSILIEYATKLLATTNTEELEHKSFAESNLKGTSFSVSCVIEKLKVSPTQARRILKELSDNGFLIKTKKKGVREPLYFFEEAKAIDVWQNIRKK